MRSILLPLLAGALAACSINRGGATVLVDRNPGQDGRWEAHDGEASAVIDAEGEGATIEWLGRTFVLRNAPRFRGPIGSDGIRLRVDIHELVITREKLTLRTRDTVRHRTLDALPDPVVIEFTRDGARFSTP